MARLMRCAPFSTGLVPVGTRLVGAQAHTAIPPLSLELHQPDVDVLATTGLAAGDGEEICAGAERLQSFTGDGNFPVVRRVAVEFGGEDAVEVDLHVLIVVELEL